MGVMSPLAPVTEQPPLIFTPHPVTLEGQEYLPVEIRDGETLGAMLDRTVDLGADAWEVKIGGVVVPVAMWDRVKPKHGHVIEVRGAVNKQALMIVAMVALIWVTGGLAATGMGAAGGIGGMAFGAGTLGAMALNIGVMMVGSIIINKVLGPKPPQGSSQDRESVFNIAGARNAVRQHEPLGFLFGSQRIAPDILSMPYSYYRGNDQYVAMVLTPGINVDRFDDLYIGDTMLSDYEGVTVWTAGFPGMPEQDIPLHTNADTVAGGELTSAAGWVIRTTPADTVQVMVNVEFLLFGVGTSGKSYDVAERVDVEYRPAGSSDGWIPLNNRRYVGKKQDPRRDTIQGLVPRGQYDVRARIAGLGDYTGSNTQANSFTWSTMVSVQADDADYRGMQRIGLEIKATGQLSGTPDQVRAVMHQVAIPVWTGTAWGTATDRASGLSNPGALGLAYARGYEDPNGDIYAGMGLPDSMIDIPAWQAYTLHCAANGYEYDHWLQSPRSHDEALNSIALAGFGQITWSGGRLSVVWAADNQPLTGVVNMATMKKGQFEVDYALINAADGIEYSYFDRETWQTATLRVPAPGVTTMLNPARLTGEGITSEAHAAQMARWHLAQHLYQFKSIGYSTDLEHMTYRRLSVLALQHDMTKWAMGGRVVAAANAGGVVTLTLDEPVTAPATGDAYIGLRILGERVHRVFEVAAFTGETDTITLADPWPSDAPLPGNTAANPAHDTIWIYDFKSTPGYRVRVTSIEPESGLKGARISCVPESPEMWTYVKTGHYEPPATVPLLPTRPVASNLAIGETQIVQGDTEYTELSATFDVSGRMGHAVVYAALMPDGVLEEVAQTVTRTATWRIPEAGQYAIVVRPFDDDGNAGEAASTTYITSRADTPPPVFDWFEVQELSGGVRFYQWGYDSDTMQAANYAGAEIRYAAGDVPAVWESMTPVGEGLHTVDFEAVTPSAGVWTFAIRARNTSGALSTGTLRIVRTLTQNLGEVLEDQQAAIDKEVFDRISEDVRVASEAAIDAAAKATAARNEAMAAVDALASEIGEIVGAPDWDVAETYVAGWLVKYDGALYRAIVDTTGQQPDLFPAVWEKIGDYASLGEAVAAALSIATVTADELAAQVIRINAIVARMPTGSGTLASEAMVATEVLALATAISAEAARTDTILARLPAAPGVLATAASVSAVESASVTRDTALGERITLTQASIGDTPDNLIKKSNFDDSETGQWGGTTIATVNLPTGNRALQLTASAYEENNWIDARPGDVFDGSAYINTGNRSGGGATVMIVHSVDKNGANIGFHNIVSKSNGVAGWSRETGFTIPMPAGVARVRPLAQVNGTGGYSLFGDLRLTRRTAADTLIAASVTAVETASVSRDNALAERATLVEARMPGGSDALATNAQVVAEQNARVAGDSAIASDLTGLSITVGNQSASLTEISKVTGSISSVLVRDPSFELRDGSWTLSPYASYTYSDTAARTGTYYLDLAAGVGTQLNHNGSRFRVEAGQTIRLWGWIRWATAAPVGGAGTLLGLRFFNEAGVDLSSNQSFAVPNAALTQVFTRHEGIVTVPANAAYANYYVGGRHTIAGSPSARVLVDDVGGEFVTGGESKFLASHTVALDVNGRISGTVNVNDGTRSEFSILADVFRVLGSGAEGMEWQDGYLRVYGAGYQRIIGYDFGAAGQGLVDWFGPNVGAASCNRANGIFWLAKDGNAYFAGDVLQGVIRTFQSSTTVGAVTVTAAATGSKGKEVALEVKFRRTYQQVYNGASSVITLGSGQTQATVQLQRRYGTGAYTNIGSAQTAIGTVEYFSESGSPSFITHYINDTIMATDVADARARQYRVVVSAITFQAHTVVNPGTTPPAENNQYTSIESME